jgi:hypothetical protein
MFLTLVLIGSPEHALERHIHSCHEITIRSNRGVRLVQLSGEAVRDLLTHLHVEKIHKDMVTDPRGASITFGQGAPFYFNVSENTDELFAETGQPVISMRPGFIRHVHQLAGPLEDPDQPPPPPKP